MYIEEIFTLCEKSAIIRRNGVITIISKYQAEKEGTFVKCAGKSSMWSALRVKINIKTGAIRHPKTRNVALK